MLMGHIVRVGSDHRAIEHSLALPRSLFHEDLRLSGAVVDATLAVRKPPILDLFSGRDVSFYVDPESLRFGSAAFLDVERLVALPYAPDAPLGLTTSVEALRAFVRGALELQSQAGAAAYVVPSLPLENNGDALTLNRRLAFAARDIIGVDVDRLPVIMTVAPATRVLSEVAPVARMLSDLPLDEVHVQPLRFRPTALSLGSLERYLDYVLALRSIGVPVASGRVGAFGLVLLALGVDAFDSGLTTSEAYDLNNAIRSAATRRQAKAEGDEPERGGRRRRFYISQVKTTVMRPVMDVLDSRELRHRFTTSLPCCASGFGSHLEHAREHCLFARNEETAQLLGVAPTMRATVLARQLEEARDTAAVLTKALDNAGVQSPSFTHLETWRRLLLGRERATRAA